MRSSQKILNNFELRNTLNCHSSVSGNPESVSNTLDPRLRGDDGKKSFVIQRNKCQSRGFGLIEIIIGSTILTVSLIAISTYFQKSLQLSQDTGKTVRASFLLEEGIEVVKFFRDTSWQNISGLTAGSSYYFQFNGTKWATTSSNIFVDNIFEKKFALNNVSRDVNDDIVSSGGTDDPDTKKVTVSVSWLGRNGTTTKSISTYITNIF